MRTITIALAALAFLSAAGAASAQQYARPSAEDMRARFENRFAIEQRGWNNAAGGVQRGAANAGAVSQAGVGNYRVVAQNGDNNNALLRQVGRNNEGALTQNNANNNACLIQLGSNLSGEIVQNGNESTGVIQTQRGVRYIPAALCTVDAPIRHHPVGRSRR